MTIRDVKTYGAVGDGVTNDATPINNALSESLPGDVVLCPPGRYRLAAGPIHVLAGTTLRGDAATLIKDHANVLIDVDGVDVVIEGLDFTGHMSLNFAIMIHFVPDAGHRGTVRGCHFSAWTVAPDGGATLHAVLSQGADDIVVEDCTWRSLQVKLGGVRSRVSRCTAYSPHNYAVSCVAIGEEDISDFVCEDVEVLDINDKSNGAVYIGSDQVSSVNGTAHRMTVRRLRVRGTWQQPTIFAPGGVFARPCRDSAIWVFQDIDVECESNPQPSNSRGLTVDWSSVPGAPLHGLLIEDVRAANVDFGLTVGGELIGATIRRVNCAAGVAAAIYARYGGISGLELEDCNPAPTIDSTIAPVTYRGPPHTARALVSG